MVPCSMLSTPARHGGLDALGSLRMDHDTLARAMGDFDGFGHLFLT